jgi:DNA-binding NarL/FixJ family response regulator
LSDTSGIGGRKALIIADDHPIVLHGLAELLSADATFSILAIATDGPSALEAILTWAPDMALLDLRMPGLTGVQVLEEMVRRGSRTRCVIFAARISDAEVYDVIETGGAGIVLKSVAVEQLVICLRTIADGGTWLEPGLVNPAIERETERRAQWLKLAASLTAREAEIVRLIVDGVPNKEIAFRLGVSDGTTKVHIGNVFRKLQVTSRLELRILVRGEGAGVDPTT